MPGLSAAMSADALGITVRGALHENNVAVVERDTQMAVGSDFANDVIHD